jgi:hypothetical protein
MMFLLFSNYSNKPYMSFVFAQKLIVPVKLESDFNTNRKAKLFGRKRRINDENNIINIFEDMPDFLILFFW